MSLEDYKAGQVNDLKLFFDTDRRSNPTAYRSGKRDNRVLGEPTPPSLSDKQTTVFRWFGDRALIYLAVAIVCRDSIKAREIRSS